MTTLQLNFVDEVLKELIFINILYLKTNGDGQTNETYALGIAKKT